ncbi:MAG: ribonuclease III [Flavobacteriales bacterium]
MIAYFKRFFYKSSFQKKLYQVIGFYPIKMSVYKLALTHKSLNKGKQNDNERLEFLGDAVLDLVVAEVLFNHFKNKSEGFLTQTRSKIVSRKTLNRLAFKIKLDKLVRRKSSETSPSIYGNALEALVGAIFVDQGYEKASYFIKEKLIKPHLKIDELAKEIASYKSKCLEWGQKNKKELKFNIVKTEGEDHNKQYTVELCVDSKKVAVAKGTSKKRAEEAAAKKVYKELT